jgi:hypothetical protein
MTPQQPTSESDERTSTIQNDQGEHQTPSQSRVEADSEPTIPIPDDEFLTETGFNNPQGHKKIDMTDLMGRDGRARK